MMASGENIFHDFPVSGIGSQLPLQVTMLPSVPLRLQKLDCFRVFYSIH